MSPERDELRELVDRLPDEHVPAVLSEARRHLVDVKSRRWPPAFFGAGRAGRGDVAERSEVEPPAAQLARRRGRADDERGVGGAGPYTAPTADP